MHIDFLLAYYCAPTLKGLKPANLILHHTFKTLAQRSSYEEAKTALLDHGIQMHRVWTCPERSLTLVYHRERLEGHLNQWRNRKFLVEMGYGSNMPFEEMIELLSSRMTLGKAFPHEVGIFLGYPLEDVLGFIENDGQNCKLCGYWKVYGNAQEAQRLFAAFTSVREGMVSQLQQGARLVELLQTAS